jgi:hypothetical protein
MAELRSLAMDPLFTSDRMKQYRDDAVAHMVTQLINDSVEEKSFSDVLDTIVAICPFDVSDPSVAGSNFLVAAKVAHASVKQRLRLWFSMYQSPM